VSSPQRRVAQPVEDRCVNLRSVPSPGGLSDAALDAAVLEGSRLAFVVHEYDREQVCKVIRHLEETGQVRAVLVALAAMVDVEERPTNMLAWLHQRADREAAAARKPWQRAEYPSCDPAQDRSPGGTVSLHGTPARHTAGCRGEGCRAARADYDKHRYQLRTGHPDPMC
jgi:hypothetical protein